MRRGAWVFAALAAGFAAGPVSGQGAGAVEGAMAVEDSAWVEGGSVVFLVRHAEAAMDGSRDPGLSEKGRARAQRLAALLADARLTAVYTTDYRRTRATAAPLANRLDLEPGLYDPWQLEPFVDSLRVRGGRVLVVGHSNTTTALVRALGGEPGTSIPEWEHDRLYIVVLPGDGPGVESPPVHGSRSTDGAGPAEPPPAPARTLLLRF